MKQVKIASDIFSFINLKNTWLWRTGGRSPHIHILSSCSGLASIREKLVRFTLDYCTNSAPVLNDLVTSLCKPQNPNFIQFLLDCSCLPEVISAAQVYGDGVLAHLFRISRTWVLFSSQNKIEKTRQMELSMEIYLKSSD
jgi:hypothetical protein